MSGILIKHQDGGSYIMDRNGEFHFYKGYEHCPIGTEVIIRKNPVRFLSRAVAAAAVFLAITTLGSYTYFSNSILYYAYLDVNPSVEMRINRLGRVKDVTGLNDGGEQLTIRLTRTGKLGEVISAICDTAEEQGYSLAGEDGVEAVQFTIICDNENSLYKLESWVSDEMASVSLPFQNRTVMICSDEERHEAIALGISPGKLQLVKELHALYPEKSIEKMARMSVADINKGIRDFEEEVSLVERELYAEADPADTAVGKEGAIISDNRSEAMGEDPEKNTSRRHVQSIAEAAAMDATISLEGAVPLSEAPPQAEAAEAEAVEKELADGETAAISESKQRNDYSDSSSGGGGKRETTAAETTGETTVEKTSESVEPPTSQTREETTEAETEETTCGRDDDDDDEDDDDKASDSNAGKGDDKDDDHGHWWEIW